MMMNMRKSILDVSNSYVACAISISSYFPSTDRLDVSTAAPDHDLFDVPVTDQLPILIADDSLAVANIILALSSV